MTSVRVLYKADLYPEMAKALEAAQRCVHVTYLHNRAPSESQNPAERAYHDAFAHVLTEARPSIVQRIVAMTPNDTEGKALWAAMEIANAAKVDRYEVKFYDASVGHLPINVAIYDDLTFIIDPCRTSDGSLPRDMVVDSPGVAALFARYFAGLWGPSSETYKKVTTPSEPKEDDPANWSTGRVLKALKPTALWKLGGAVVAIISAAFAAGVALAPILQKAPAPRPTSFQSWIAEGSRESLFQTDLELRVIPVPDSSNSRLIVAFPGGRDSCLAVRGARMEFSVSGARYTIDVSAVDLGKRSVLYFAQRHQTSD